MSKTKNASNRKMSFAELVSLLSGVLIFLSFWRIYTFYQHFGIELSQYISITEPVVLALSSWAMLTFLVLGFLMYFIVHWRFQKGTYELAKQTEEESFEQKLFSKHSFIVRAKFYLGISAILAVCLISLAIVANIVRVCLYDEEWDYFLEFWFILVLPVGYFVLLELLYFAIDELESFLGAQSLPRSFRWLLILFITMLSINGYSKWQATRAEEGRRPWVTIKFDNEEEWSSDSNHVWLGKTADYVYLYDRETKTTEIRKMAHVKIIIYH